MKIVLCILSLFATMQTRQTNSIIATNLTLNSSVNVEVELENVVNDLLGDLDLSDFDKKYIDEYKIFGNTTFKQKVVDILNGEYFDNYDSIFKALLSIVFDGVASIVPMLLAILAVAILCSILQSVKSDSKNNVSSIINFVCMAVIISIISTNFAAIINKTNECLSVMKGQMDSLFPIILTLIGAIGGNVSVGIFKPVIAVLSTWISSLFQSILLPIFILSFLFVIIGSLSPNVKLNKFNSFLSSSFKWIVGFVFTIFGAFLTIQGISAGKFDGVSIKAGKFAIKSYVPIIGGYISDGFDLIMLGSVLIKNAVGVGGLIMLFLTIISPLIQIVVFKLGLQLVAGLVESANNKEMSGVISDCSKILNFPIVIILGVAFMYILLISLLMCTVNIL